MAENRITDEMVAAVFSDLHGTHPKMFFTLPDDAKASIREGLVPAIEIAIGDDSFFGPDVSIRVQLLQLSETVSKAITDTLNVLGASEEDFEASRAAAIAMGELIFDESEEGDLGKHQSVLKRVVKDHGPASYNIGGLLLCASILKESGNPECWGRVESEEVSSLIADVWTDGEKREG